jgi:hypothetical protein
VPNCDAGEFSIGPEAVLPRLSANPSLSELVVFGGRLGYDRGLPLESMNPNSLSFMSAVGHALGAATSLTRVSLKVFVFNSENIAALVSGLEACQSVSLLCLQCCWFSNDGCSETFAAFMRSVNVTNPTLKHLDILGCKIKDSTYNSPCLPSMFVQAPLQVLEMGDHIKELCQAWVSDPESVTLQGLILRYLEDTEWDTLVQTLPLMKSLRKLTVTQLNMLYRKDLFVEHMRNQWNLQTVKLKLNRGETSFLDDSQQRLVDAFGMRNRNVPTMLARPMLPGGDDCGSVDEPSEIQDQEGKLTLVLFPCLFHTALRTKSKSPHILLLGLVSAQDAIGSAWLDEKRPALHNHLR